MVLLALLTAILLSGNHVYVGGRRGRDREEVRANVFGLGYYLHNSQE